jgi:outer membrane lipoprotein carrier protein
MKTKPHWTISFLWIFIVSVALSPGQVQADRVLEEILQKTEARYQQLKAYTADFGQWSTSSATNTMTTEASGKLYYQKPRKMCWKYKTPEVQTFVVNQQYAWLHVPEEKQISLVDAKEFFSSPLAQTFFDGIFELRNHFKVSLDLDNSTKTAAILELIPKKEDPQVKSLRLWIDLRSYNIFNVETQDALGNTNRLMIKKQKEVDRLNPKLFELKIPSETVVLDASGRELSPSEIRKIKRQLHSR